MTRSPLTFRLSGARRAVDATLISTASVYRKTQTTDNAGGFTDTYAVVATYQCRFYAYPITPIEKESTTQVQAVVFWRFIFSYDADIEPTDRLMVGTRTFEVVQALVGSIEITLDVLCQEITLVMHTDELDGDVVEETPPEPVYCRHCGEQAPEGTDADSNWLCKECERYQDSQVCPTCQSVVSASQLPEDMVPEAHAPKKHKKAKE